MKFTFKNNVRKTKTPSSCPSCGCTLQIKVLECPECHTEVKGSFHCNPFSHLSKEEESFLLSFLLSRGSLKEVQERLNISYPTARNRLDKLLASLQINPKPSENKQPETSQTNNSKQFVQKKQDVVSMLTDFENEEIDFDELIQNIKK